MEPARKEQPGASALPSVYFQVEDFRSTVDEAVPLALQQAREMGVAAKPRMEAIAAGSEAGAVVWITARRNREKMVGYALFTLAQDLVFRDVKVASCEVFYIDRSASGLASQGLRMMRFAENELRKHGATAIQYYALPGSTFAKLLNHTGHRCLREVYGKRIF